MIQFTENCEAAVKNHGLDNLNTDLEQQLESYTSVDITSTGQNDVDAHVLELKLKALILDTIHNIDVVQLLSERNIKNIDDWLWQKQLRSDITQQYPTLYCSIPNIHILSLWQTFVHLPRFACWSWINVKH